MSDGRKGPFDGLSPEDVRSILRSFEAIKTERNELKEKLRAALDEIEILKGPFTCEHDPQYAGGACSLCHAMALIQLERLEKWFKTRLDLERSAFTRDAQSGGDGKVNGSRISLLEEVLKVMEAVCPVCKNLVYCTCQILREHERGCRYRRAAALSVEIACDHGLQACPQCDPCTCNPKKPMEPIR